MSSHLTAAQLTKGLGAPDDVVEFAHTPGTQVVFGAGVVARVGDLAKGLGGTHVLLVTDPGIAKAGHEAWVSGHLEKAGLEITVFDEVHENPTTEDVAKCVAAAMAADIDIIIGLGGGSSMDTAKGANFLLTNGGEMKDYWGVGKATQDMLPLIAIPTTAGTGSECQSFALIADAKTHMKMACGDKKAAASVAILDPELTLTQPALVTAHTGIDAITHAVETFVTNKRTPTSSAYAKLAFQLLEPSLEQVIRNPRDLEARARMQLGAAYAGTAIENSMLGAAHAAANPLTAHYDIVHGEAVGMMLPHVVRHNGSDSDVATLYGELYDGDLATRLVELLESCGMPERLAQRKVDATEISMLAGEAAAQWTANFNPLAVDTEQFEALYGAAM
jgi:alcohol dehydrogenase